MHEHVRVQLALPGRMLFSYCYSSTAAWRIKVKIVLRHALLGHSALADHHLAAAPDKLAPPLPVGRH